jgi:hypothetical protein
MLFWMCAPPLQREPFLRSASLGQGVVLNHRVSSFPQNVFILNLLLKNSAIEFETQIIIELNF